jgi:putative peptidoglycan lipid II flippase
MYERGAFTPEASHMTYMVLVFGSLGIFTYAARDLFIRVFYAMHDSRAPLFVSLFSMGLTVALMAAMIGPFGLLGLAAATSIVTVANCLLVAFLLRRKLGRLSLTGFVPLFLKAFVASTAAAGAAWGLGHVLTLPPGFLGNAGRVVLQGGALVAVYGLVLALVGVPVLAQVQTLTRRFRPKRAVAESAESSATA